MASTNDYKKLADEIEQFRQDVRAYVRGSAYERSNLLLQIVRNNGNQSLAALCSLIAVEAETYGRENRNEQLKRVYKFNGIAGLLNSAIPREARFDESTYAVGFGGFPGGSFLPPYARPFSGGLFKHSVDELVKNPCFTGDEDVDTDGDDFDTFIEQVRDLLDEELDVIQFRASDIVTVNVHITNGNRNVNFNHTFEQDILAKVGLSDE